MAKTRSGIPLEPVYGRAEMEAAGAADPEAPGQPPFTRGITPRMYAERPWIMGQYAGFGSAEQTNARFKDLLRAGQTGFSVALDLPADVEGGLRPPDDVDDHQLVLGDLRECLVRIGDHRDRVADADRPPVAGAQRRSC